MNQLTYQANTGDMPVAHEVEAALETLRSPMNQIRPSLARQVLRDEWQQRKAVVRCKPRSMWRRSATGAV